MTCRHSDMTTAAEQVTASSPHTGVHLRVCVRVGVRTRARVCVVRASEIYFASGVRAEVLWQRVAAPTWLNLTTYGGAAASQPVLPKFWFAFFCHVASFTTSIRDGFGKRCAGISHSARTAEGSSGLRTGRVWPSASLCAWLPPASRTGCVVCTGRTLIVPESRKPRLIVPRTGRRTW